jgi:hypothetical protein
MKGDKRQRKPNPTGKKLFERRKCSKTERVELRNISVDEESE